MLRCMRARYRATRASECATESATSLKDEEQDTLAGSPGEPAVAHSQGTFLNSRLLANIRCASACATQGSG